MSVSRPIFGPWELALYLDVPYMHVLMWGMQKLLPKPDRTMGQFQAWDEATIDGWQVPPSPMTTGDEPAELPELVSEENLPRLLGVTAAELPALRTADGFPTGLRFGWRIVFSRADVLAWQTAPG